MKFEIRVIALLLVVSGMAGCTESTDTSSDQARTGAAAKPEAPDFAAALQSPDRPEADRQADAWRKPQQMIAFFGIEPGMTVLDLFAAGGYYTEVLAAAVGLEGRVYSHNSEFLLTVREGVFDKRMTERLANDRLPNVVRYHREPSDMGLEPGQLDAISFVQNYHDIYNFPEPERMAFLRQLLEALKPGGILAVIDHAADPGPFEVNLHRIDEAIVREELTSLGFVLDNESDLLRNPEDDRTRSVFDPEIRGNTDRLALRFRKP